MKNGEDRNKSHIMAFWVALAYIIIIAGGFMGYAHWFEKMKTASQDAQAHLSDAVWGYLILVVFPLLVVAVVHVLVVYFSGSIFGKGIFIGVGLGCVLVLVQFTVLATSSVDESSAMAALFLPYVFAIGFAGGVIGWNLISIFLNYLRGG